jgi:hypothetical protein
MFLWIEKCSLYVGEEPAPPGARTAEKLMLRLGSFDLQNFLVGRALQTLCFLMRVLGRCFGLSLRALEISLSRLDTCFRYPSSHPSKS